MLRRDQGWMDQVLCRICDSLFCFGVFLSWSSLLCRVAQQGQCHCMLLLAFVMSPLPLLGRSWVALDGAELLLSEPGC